MVIKKLERIEIILGPDGLEVCSLRDYLLREVPKHEDRKLLEQRHCYSQCNSSCPKHPMHGLY